MYSVGERPMIAPRSTSVTATTTYMTCISTYQHATTSHQSLSTIAYHAHSTMTALYAHHSVNTLETTNAAHRQPDSHLLHRMHHDHHHVAALLHGHHHHYHHRDVLYHA